MKKSYIAIALLAFLGSCASHKAVVPSSTPQAKTATTGTEALRARLAGNVAAGKTLFGHHDDTAYGHTWFGEEGRSDVKETVGEYPAMMSWDLGRLELGDTANLDRVPFSKIRREAQAQHRRGGVNTFSWHPWNPVTGTDSWTTTDSTVVRRMVTDPEYTAAYRAQVRRLADFFNTLTDERGEKIPVIFRPWHEQTGGWFFWGKPYCTPEEYKALWHIMREEMDAAGVDNLLWAYSPDRVSTKEEYLERYPGNEYVDILGTDIYHFNGEAGVQEYIDVASRNLGIVTATARELGKIPAFTETGSEALPMADWWTDTLLPLLKENSVSFVVVWRNASDRPTHYYAPFPGEHSVPSFKRFHNDPTTIFVK